MNFRNMSFRNIKKLYEKTTVIDLHRNTITSNNNRKIINFTNWKSLADQKFENMENLIVKCGYDIHPFDPSPTFKTKNLFLHRCDKNFLYYWLNNETFQGVENIFLYYSHPCERIVINEQTANLFIESSFEELLKRWNISPSKYSILTEKQEDNLKRYFSLYEVDYTLKRF